MRITLHEASDPRAVLITIDDKPAHLPAWIVVRPDDGKPFVTNDPEHALDVSTGRDGEAKTLLDTVRSYLAGEIDYTMATERVQAALAPDAGGSWAT